MARIDETRRSLIVGTSVIAFGIVFVIGVGLFQSKGLFKAKVEITADFRQVSGLKPGSPVQLEGIEIGMVKERRFVEIEYPCDPATEDRGRFGQGRTDNCDQTLFCAPEGKCAELEPYNFNKDLYPRCEQNDQCREGEICVSAEFRRRYRKVSWNGDTGMCDVYIAGHKRIRVVMAVYADRMQHIRDDSRATISQNGVLGDQLVQLSAGRGTQIEPGGQVQTIPAMIETLDTVKDRADGMFDKVESTIGGVAELAKTMGDEKTVRNIQDLLANANDVTRRTAEGTGSFGTLLNDESTAKDFSNNLRGVRESAGSLDRTLDKARSGLQTFEQDLEPAVKTGRDSMAKISGTFADIRDPNSKSVVSQLLNDPEGKLVREVEGTLSGVRRLGEGINAGEGTAGRLLRDPKVYDDLVGFFQGLGRSKAIGFLVWWARRRDTRDPRIPREPDSE
ncbi:MAG: MCE family protein [Myxococcales bacterium]|nr:MCE family protein [Myxococcales bacterium]